MQNLLRILSISDPQISLNRLGCTKKKTEMRYDFKENKINVNIPNFCLPV